MTQLHSFNRRTALAGLAAAPFVTGMSATAQDRAAIPVAGVVTVYQPNSHADVIIGKVLEGWRQDGGRGPDLKLAALYVDQFPNADMSRRLSKKHGFPITKTIEEAITLGTKEVQVAGVLSIGEHGSYGYTKDTRQHKYPRRRFFDAIVKAMGNGGKYVPIFNDKHLAWNWKDGKHMYDTAKRLKIPFMAGSSLPTAWRYPNTVMPLGAEIEEAIAIGYGGLESYGFHALETLQCVTERRRGGETGVATVRAIQGEEIWKARNRGEWSLDLLQGALATFKKNKLGEGDIRKGLNKNAAFYQIGYRDGTKATVAMCQGLVDQFALAVKIRGRKQPIVNWFKLEDKPYGHFEHLLRAIQPMFHTGKPSYPVERTLMTTGILDRAMHSVYRKGKKFSTPELASVSYKSADWPFANRGIFSE